MMPPYSWSVPGMKPGTSTKVSRGTLKASQTRTKREAFSDESMSSTPASTAGWLPTIPTARPGESARDRHGPVAVDLEVVAVVDHGPNDPLHVVGLIGRGRHEADQLGHLAFGIIAGHLHRRLLQVV